MSQKHVEMLIEYTCTRDEVDCILSNNVVFDIQRRNRNCTTYKCLGNLPGGRGYGKEVQLAKEGILFAGPDTAALLESECDNKRWVKASTFVVAQSCAVPQLCASSSSNIPNDNP